MPQSTIPETYRRAAAQCVLDNIAFYQRQDRLVSEIVDEIARTMMANDLEKAIKYNQNRFA